MTPDQPTPPLPREEMPTRAQALLFVLKASLFQVRRTLVDLVRERPRRLVCRPMASDATVVGEWRGPLYAGTAPAEFALQAGKVQNLRVAASHLNGLVVPAGAVFSFWANVPRPTRARGFAVGRELREGCVIPSIGGGLCQLSNALHEVALQAGLEIVERHAHSRRLPGALAAAGRDATVFWNYVDLRFLASSPGQLEVRVEQQELVVRWHALGAGARPVSTRPPPGLGEVVPEEEPAESCETCGVVECFRNPSAAALAREGFTAWLVDAFAPEFDSWMRAHRETRDWLFTPLDSRRFRVGPYGWNTAGFACVRQAPWAVLRRSLVSRRLATQGGARQRALLRMDEVLANAFARQLNPLATHLVVSQNLLPFLWRRGDLGGRTFDVLMIRLPIAELERALDRAAKHHPESPTLADFRASHDLVEAETEALAAARHWITPHSAIAQLAGARAVKLDWRIPMAAPAQRGKWIVFPASTLGRKGAWELRDVARELSLPVRLGGAVLEGPEFWTGVQTENAGSLWLEGARGVVAPAWVEHQPRRLLQAVAAGIPVVASEACGLAGVPGVTTFPTGDAEALREAVSAALAGLAPASR